MQDELARFVESLAIPAERKAIVLAELTDHVACAREAATRQGRDADAAERAVLGELESTRASLETVEPQFHLTRWHAIARGVLASVAIAVTLDQGGPLVYGIVGWLLAIALLAVFAPPHMLPLVRRELRVRRARGGIPIGPALTYLLTVLIMPFAIWIGLITARAFVGITVLEVPWSAYAAAIAICTLLLVEGIRARTPKAA